MNIMTAMKAMKSAIFVSEPTATKVEMLVEGGDKKVTLTSYGADIVTMEILDSHSVTSVELDSRKNLSSIVACTLEMIYETRSGVYTVEAKTGVLTVGSPEWKIEVKILKETESASVKFTRDEALVFVENIRSFYN